MGRFSRLTLTAVLALCVLATSDGSARSAPSGPSARWALHATSTPADATTALGLDLMRHLGSGNIVFSPDSVATALAMVGTGAAGETARQIAGAIRLASPAVFPAVGKLQRRIAREQVRAASGNPEAPTLDLADGLFLQSGFRIEPSFANGLRQHFDTTIERLDFGGDPTGATSHVNRWVSDRTQGLIPRLLARLTPFTRVILANAVYLKATWRHQFDERATRPDNFFSPSGTRRVSFMHETAELGYTSGNGYEALDLPYAASTLSLTLLLPVNQSVEAMLRRLTPRRLTTILRHTTLQYVRVSLPRFHLSLAANLVSPLISLGLLDAFDPNLADFSRIDQTRRLWITEVMHAADFAVDEHGTVAAASTGVTLEDTVAHSRRAVFDADRPFLFFLRDDRSGTVLFAGRLSDPSP